MNGKSSNGSRRTFDPLRYPHSELTEQIIGAIIEVHRQLGPGYVEKIYELALVHELTLRGLNVERQKRFIVNYKGKFVGQHQADLVVTRTVLLELKAVDTLLPVHKARTLSTLKASGLQVALLVNFSEAVVKNGIKRIVASDASR